MSNSAFTPTFAQNLQDASATQSGLVNTSSQTLAGDKTFNGAIKGTDIQAKNSSGIVFKEDGGTTVGEVSDNGGWTLGPSSGNVNHTIYTNVTTFSLPSNGGAINLNSNSQSWQTGNNGSNSAGPGGTNGYYWYDNTGAKYVGGISTAGGWTFGPSGYSGTHTINGNATVSKNLSIGNTSLSSWSSNMVAVEGVGADGVVFASANNSLAGLSSNVYYNSGWKYKTTSAVAIYTAANGQCNTYTAASGTAGNSVTLVTGPYVANGGTSWTNGSSDIRQKKDFEPCYGLMDLMNVETFKYRLISDSEDSTKRIGFSAQNLQTVVPEMVCEKSEKAEDGTPFLAVTTDYMVPILVKAVQELKQQLDEAKAKIAVLESK